MNRRTLLLGIGASLCAPAIVRAGSLMPVRGPRLVMPTDRALEGCLGVRGPSCCTGDVGPPDSNFIITRRFLDNRAVQVAAVKPLTWLDPDGTVRTNIPPGHVLIRKMQTVDGKSVCVAEWFEPWKER